VGDSEVKDAEHVTFGGAGLDRAAELRAEADALARQPGACILAVWKGKPLLRETGGGLASVFLAPDSPLFADGPGTRVFLGRSGGVVWFAADISDWAPEGQDVSTVGAFQDSSEQRHPDLPEDHRFVELRGAMMRLSARDAELAATARGVLGWHAMHLFCARCGAKSEVADAGWQRLCPACGARHFPRTDPVVIMLVTHGDSVLLGRSPHWPDGMYSLLAGFVEPGETIEAAVRREVYEEAGIRVGEVGYLASQPWPFPSSLMIGCHGTALGREIRLDPVELEDALWITRQELLAVHAGESGRLKPARRGAIAHFLLERWLADRLD
jgi:NAD+ diphosphatase